MTNIGILHPGAMGISVAASAQNSGHTVYWVSQGRSLQTRERAAKFNLQDVGTLDALCDRCAVIVSVCPPHAAQAVAGDVMAGGFEGLYVDANAISPQRAVALDRLVRAAGATFVDGGIIGGPAWKAGETRLYLSGEAAQEAADCFANGPLETRIIGDSSGKASALKMCYAAYTKGTTALLCGILAAAEELGVGEELDQEWSDWGDFAVQTRERARRVTAKAWRFEGEMEEIAATFGEIGLPQGFHAAAAEIYHRLAPFKDASPTPPLAEVLAALLDEPPDA